MAMTLPVVVYGSGQIFTEYFNAIAAAIGGDAFHVMFKIAVLLAGMTILFSSIAKRDFLQCVRWLGAYYVVFYVLFLPQVSVEVIDRTDQGHSYHVDKVPLGLGVLASLTTVIGDSLTQLTDKIFSMPDDLRYSKTGMMMASKLALAASQFQITDPKLSESMQSFVSQCVFYDLLLNKYTINDLFQSANTWDFIKSKASPARAFLYNGSVTTCSDGAGSLTADLQGNIEQTATRYGVRLFPQAKTPTDAKDQLLKYLPISYKYLINLSGEAANIMQQNLVANAIQSGALRFGASVNAPAALESYAYTRAQEQQRLTYQTLGDSAAYWLPIMKNAFEAIMYGCFIFIILLAVFPFGPSVLKNYAYTLVWIQTWAPLYAVINLICSYYAQTNSMAASSQGITLQSFSGLIQVNQDMASLAGYLSLSVPFLAAGLVKGMAGTMTQLAQYIGGVTQSVGSSAAAEAALGNFSMGNTNFGVHSAFNTSANHFDTAGHMNSAMSYQLPGGETVSIMPDGTSVMDVRGAISNLGADINYAESIRTAASRQADLAYNASLNHSQASAKSMSEGMRNLYEIGDHLGTSSASGKSWVYSQNAAVTDAFNQVHSLTNKYAHDHNISYEQAAHVLTTASISGELGGGIPAKFISPVKADISYGRELREQRQDTASARESFSDAQEFVKTSGYSHAVDVASRATQDNSLRYTNETGERLIKNAGASFEQANSFRQEAASSLQTASGYREVATKAQEDSFNVNINASQSFKDWLSNQPGTNGQGHMGLSQAAALHHDPALLKTYVDRYSDQYARSMVSNWDHGMAHSKEGIQAVYESNNHQVGGEETIRASYQQHHADIEKKANQDGLNKETLIDNSAQSQVGDTLNQSMQQVNTEKTTADKHAQEQQKTISGWETKGEKLSGGNK